jgi:uncharacterized membrane protein (DUF2068 family)
MADPALFDGDDDPHSGIRLGEPGPTSESTRWGLLLTWFMRTIAMFWLLQGLMQWYIVLTAPKSIFETLPSGAATAVIFFAVLDLVAGVGLWLATPWGGVLWLLIASAQIFVTLSVPGFFVGGYYLIGLDLVLIVLYFVLTYEAGRDFETQRLRDRRKRAQQRAMSVTKTTSLSAASAIARAWLRNLRNR